MQKLKSKCGMIRMKNVINQDRAGTKIKIRGSNIIYKLPLVISRTAFDLFCSNSSQLMLEMLITTISTYFVTVL